MSPHKCKLEGGQGGKLGHGRMSHYTYTHEVKQATKKRRRREDVREMWRQLRDAAA